MLAHPKLSMSCSHPPQLNLETSFNSKATNVCPMMIAILILVSLVTLACVVIPLGNPDAQLNPKEKVFESIQMDLKTSPDGIAMYRDAPFEIIVS